ncbi:MarR family winged helix-turn-helix transcriptional regulator [Microbacterium sp.]|uniref:MarR family winged helix-turn-helix transcriptional regulator n=1 Tax=Microbacterium sp. TaxID=51671 RepID=UPI003734E2D0
MDKPDFVRSERAALVLAALESVQVFSDSMDRMYADLRGDMDMNMTDLAAIRMLVIRERLGEVVKPHDIAEHLAISTASTTKLLDRLAAGGYLTRQPHPGDRRSRIVVLTDAARVEFFRRFGARLSAMREALNEYSDDELRTIVRFLRDMGGAMVKS